MSARGGTPAERTVQLDITLLGREFKVGCKEHERVELMDAVATVSYTHLTLPTKRIV